MCGHPCRAGAAALEATQDQAPELDEQSIRTGLAETDGGLLPLLDNFLALVAPLGVRVSVQRSLTLHWELPGVGKINFGSIFPNGKLATIYICGSADAAGDVTIGEDYLERLSALIPDSRVRKTGTPWTWKVVVGPAGDLPPVRPLLEQAVEWAAIIARAQERFRQRVPMGG
jgi:hypothetical protein